MSRDVNIHSIYKFIFEVWSNKDYEPIREIVLWGNNLEEAAKKAGDILPEGYYNFRWKEIHEEITYSEYI